MTLPDDRELQLRFEALRGADARRVPAFGPMRERAERAAQGSSRPRRRWPVLALALAAAMLLAVGLVREARRRAFVAQPLSTWTSPTAGLLRTPGSAWLASSALPPSPLDHLAGTPAPLEGK